MSKPAVAANRIKDLEAQVADQAVTIAAQADEIVDQLNLNLALRKAMIIQRAQLNGTGDVQKDTED